MRNCEDLMPLLLDLFNGSLHLPADISLIDKDCEHQHPLSWEPGTKAANVSL